MRYAVSSEKGNALHMYKGSESVKKRKSIPIFKETEKEEI
jgi:hypothetical protein